MYALMITVFMNGGVFTLPYPLQLTHEHCAMAAYLGNEKSAEYNTAHPESGTYVVYKCEVDK